MIEVTYDFGNMSGNGYATFVVNVEPKKHGFDTDAYVKAISRSIKEFQCRQPEASISAIVLRKIEPKDCVLELEDAQP